MKKMVFALSLFSIFVLGCTQQDAGLANPSAVYCEEQGYTYDVRQEEGGSAGYCIFGDGTECPGWDYYNGLCPVEEEPEITEEEAPLIVVIQNFEFQPEEFTISAGETVTWVNTDTLPHQVMNDAHDDLAMGDLFESANLNTGDEFRYTFEEAGEYHYHCHIHPSMTGTIIVE